MAAAMLAVWCGTWIAAAQQAPQPPATAQTPAMGGMPAPRTAPQAGPQTAPQAGPHRAAVTDTGGLMLENVSLAELVDLVARRLKINYILDPHFKGGSVTIHTYGQVKPTDLMPLLETILRVNGASLVKVGDLYRVVPVEKVSQLPLPPSVNGKDFPDDERMTLNLVFLKYATAGEILKLIQPFLGEGAAAATYDPANLLILQDNNRNMKRTMDLLALFDNDAFVSQRVHLYDVTNGRPTDLVKQLEAIFKAVSLSDKTSAVKFVPIDRINTIVAVAPNPGVFDQVGQWLKKLDVPVKPAAGAVDNYVYRLKYGRAETMALAIMALYSGNPMALLALSQMNNNMMSGMMSNIGPGTGGGGGGMGYGGGSFGGGSYGGGGYGGGGGGGYGGGGYGGGGYGGGGYGGGGYGGGGYGGGGYGGTGSYGSNAMNPFASVMGNTTGTQTGAQAGGAAGATGDQTGTYLNGSPTSMPHMPRIIPNPFDNTLLVQSTPEEWEQISRLLVQLDVAPRQILVEAKIFEVQLSGDLQYGLQYFLQNKGTAAPSGFTGPPQAGGFLGNLSNAVTTLTGGFLVGHSRELLAQLTAMESTGKVKTINEPSLIATDSIPAVMNVGSTVPTLSSTVASGVQSGGNTLFANNVSNVSSGVTLVVNARVNSSGIITMLVNQQISTPGANTITDISSPSFSNRSFQTQMTVQDGDTVAIGGFIQETVNETSGGIPFLQRIPVLGAAFGSKSKTTARDELIVFFTPHVIYDTSSMAEATDDLKTGLTHMKKELKDQQ
jgi:general secretion pathway protein D